MLVDLNPNNKKKDLFKDIGDAWDINYDKEIPKKEAKHEQDLKPKKNLLDIPNGKTKPDKGSYSQEDFSLNIENLPELHDFYGENSDEKKVVCPFDSEFSNEHINITLLKNPMFK